MIAGNSVAGHSLRTEFTNSDEFTDDEADFALEVLTCVSKSGVICALQCYDQLEHAHSPEEINGMLQELARLGVLKVSKENSSKDKYQLYRLNL